MITCALFVNFYRICWSLEYKFKCPVQKKSKWKYWVCKWKSVQMRALRYCPSIVRVRAKVTDGLQANSSMPFSQGLLTFPALWWLYHMFTIISKQSNFPLSQSLVPGNILGRKWPATIRQAYCVQFEGDWDEGVPIVLFVAREVIQESLGFIPNKPLLPTANLLEHVSAFWHMLHCDWIR